LRLRYHIAVTTDCSAGGSALAIPSGPYPDFSKGVALSQAKPHARMTSGAISVGAQRASKLASGKRLDPVEVKTLNRAYRVPPVG
jgi:hypothetical protein